MALHAKKLYYRRGEATYSIDLYTTTAEVGSEYITLRDGSTTVYAALGDVVDAAASHLRVQKSDVTYAVLSEFVATQAFTIVSITPAAGKGCYRAAVSGDGLEIATVALNSPKMSTYAWNAGNNRYEGISYDVAPIYPTDCAISADSNFLVTTQYNSSPYMSAYKWSSANSRWERTAISGSALNGAHAAAISSDGSIAIIGSAFSSSLSLFRWNSGTSTYVLDSTAFDTNMYGSTYGCAISDDGQVIAAAHNSNSPYVTTYRWSSGLSKYVKTANPDTIRSTGTHHASLSPDGSVLAVGGWSTCTVYVWSVANSRYELTTTLDIDSYQVGGVAISTDEEYLVIAGAPTHGGAEHVLNAYKKISKGVYDMTPVYSETLPGNSQKCDVSSKEGGVYTTAVGLYTVSPYVAVRKFT